MDPALETQATVSTANTGSLTPLGEGSSPDGRTVVDGTSGDRNTSSPLEALTVASEEFCNPQVGKRWKSLQVFLALSL